MNSLPVPPINFSLFDLSLNLGIGFLLSTIISLHYLYRSKTRILRKDLAYALPAIGLTTLLVITVVKSSLALSLGLVGALSIVRFRTPIKEPEELGYLFLTIAIGLGFGAGFITSTVLITLSILTYLYFMGASKGVSKIDGEYTLLVKTSINTHDEVIKVIGKRVTAYKIIRTETFENKLNTYFNISIDDEFNLQELLNELKNSDEDFDFSMVESGVNW